MMFVIQYTMLYARWSRAEIATIKLVSHKFGLCFEYNQTWSSLGAQYFLAQQDSDPIK